MKKVICLLPLLFSFLESVSCTQGTWTSIRNYYSENNVIAEGTVKYLYLADTAIDEHSGYYLSDPEWFTVPRDTNSVLYIFHDFDMEPYINRHVHIEGSIKRVSGKNIYDYQEIVVDSIRVIN